MPSRTLLSSLAGPEAPSSGPTGVITGDHGQKKVAMPGGGTTTFDGVSTHASAPSSFSPGIGDWRNGGEDKRPVCGGSRERGCAGHLARGVPRVSAARADFLRRADCPPGLFPFRVRRASALARRGCLRRSGRPLPVPAGPGQQSGRHGPGPAPRGVARIARGVGSGSPCHPPCS